MVKEVLKVLPETGGAYEAPKCEVMELQMEGVLCNSGWVPDWPGHGGGTDDPNDPNWKAYDRR